MSTSEDGRCLFCDRRGSGCSCKTKTLLIVDDQEPLRRALARGLEIYGWNAITVADPIEAREHYSNVHVVLTDWDMPNGGGERVLRESTVPVVVHTGGSAPVPHLTKPVSLTELDKALREAARDLDRIHMLGYEAIVALIDINDAELLAVVGGDSKVHAFIRMVRDTLDDMAMQMAIEMARVR